MESAEIWRPLWGREERVEISSLGRVKIHNYRNTGETRIVESSMPCRARPYVTFGVGKKHIDIHKAVVVTFPDICGNWKKGMHIHHKNGDKTDNRAENLCVLSPAEHRKLHPHTEEVKRKMSELQKGSRNGFAGKHHSEEMRRHFSETRKGRIPWNKGKKMDADLREKNRLAHIGITAGERNGMYGRHRTEEEKEAIRRAQSKPVYQYTIDGELVKVWPSIREASLAMGKTTIYKCCYGKIQSVNGFIWRLSPLDDV